MCTCYNLPGVWCHGGLFQRTRCDALLPRVTDRSLWVVGVWLVHHVGTGGKATVNSRGRRELPTIHVWDLTTGETICEIKGKHKRAISCLAFSPDDKCVRPCSGAHATRAGLAGGGAGLVTVAVAVAALVLVTVAVAALVLVIVAVAALVLVTMAVAALVLVTVVALVRQRTGTHDTGRRYRAAPSRTGRWCLSVATTSTP